MFTKVNYVIILSEVFYVTEFFFQNLIYFALDFSIGRLFKILTSFNYLFMSKSVLLKSN